MYTLILTILFSGPYSYGHQSVVHIEHDYPNADICQQAYTTARKQISKMSSSDLTSIDGTCLYLGPRK
jgi:hypothetical protein